MLIIADARMPQTALEKLAGYGTLLPFHAPGITYESISGHPDIFFCKTPQGLLAAPNTPEVFLSLLKKQGIPIITGARPVSSKYPGSACYNAFANSRFLVHHPRITDTVLAEALSSLQTIPVAQGYARCNLMEAGGLYITSDRGIEKALKRKGLETFFADPAPIILPGQKHGFIGGCMGAATGRLFICGSLDFHPSGQALRKALKKRNTEIVELYHGPLWDGGSILICDEKPR